MATLKTPGVYVEEIVKFPPSVAPVATAIPAFIGYTEKATKLQTGDLTMVPTRISSMLEYQTYFGFAEYETAITVEVNSDDKIIVNNGSPSEFKMYYSLQMYFANGGGPCYIVSVGGYSSVSIGTSTSGLTGGLAAIRKEDEPTLILFPDAQELSSGDYYSLYQSALTQCADLQDRFTIMDTYTDSDSAIDDFRTGIGVNNLKYGAAYYPFLETILDYRYADGAVSVNDATSESSEDALEALTDSIDSAELASAITALMSIRDVIIDTTPAGATIVDPDLSTVRNRAQAIIDYLTGLRTTLNDAVQIALFESANTEAGDLQDWIDDTLSPLISSLTSIQTTLNSTTNRGTILNNLHENVSGNIYGLLGVTTPLGTVDSSTNPNPAIGAFTFITDIDDLVSTGELSLVIAAVNAPGSNTTTLDLLETNNNALYNRIKAAIADYPVVLPPSSAMAGIYARVDNAVGVWKAPANVSLTYVQKPTVQISNEEQEDMNVTSTGKSVNAIRTFTGKGTLVWGARTLAGNDNEWRYISVRRFFNFVEESVSEATEQFVFEPNNKNTHVRIQGMIENFLLQQWKAGALTGAKPEDAFYVRIGLGQTMTSEDILNGIMNVEIGMAVVRPAEFIVLKFSHKMQEA